MEIKKGTKMEKIINFILNVLISIFGVILIISIYNNIQVNVFKKDYSDFFGYSVFEVKTGSMVPKINPGDWIIVKSTKNIEIDDVITYKQSGEYITHRVIGAYNNTYVTKGDANNSKDDPIDSKQIVGEVVKILPGFGFFKKTIFNPYVLVAIISTIMICNYVFKKNKKETKEELEEKKEKIEKNIDISNKIDLLKEKLSKPKKEKKEKNAVEKKEEPIVEEFTPVVMEQTEEEYDEMVEEISSYIAVDVSELDDTFLEIAKNEIEEEPQVQVVSNKKEELDEIIEEKPSKLNLELLEAGKKSKNLMEKFISLKIDEINEIIELLDYDKKSLVNEPTIKNKLIGKYIEARYYNYYGDLDLSNHKKQSIKIEKYLDYSSELIKKQYNGSDLKFSDKVDKYLCIIKIVMNLEMAMDTISDKKAKDEFYKTEILKYELNGYYDNNKIKELINEIIKVQRNYVGIIEYLFKKFETNMFELEVNKLKTDKNISCLYLEHNINFSKIYSDYIIDKTYNEGVIAENKTMILINFMSIKLINDMINSDFDKKYIISLPESLYSKGKKLEKILSMLEDEYAKENVIIILSMQSLIGHKITIKKFKKLGYKFAVAITEQADFDSKNHATLALVEHIYVDKNISNIVKTVSLLPEDIVDKIVYENIIEKIGDFGGEW